MKIKEVLQDIVRSIPTENIPVRFINMAKIKKKDGSEETIKGSTDLDKFFSEGNSCNIVETRIIIDCESIHRTIMNEVDYVLAQVEKLQRDRFL